MKRKIGEEKRNFPEGKERRVPVCPLTSSNFSELTDKEKQP